MADIAVSTGISDEEVKAIRWVEWILAPLLVVSVIALSKCTANAQDELIILQKDVSTQNKNISNINGETKKALKELAEKQDELLDSQHKLEKEVTEISTHQEHFKTEIEHLQDQSSEILRILREQ